MERIPYRPTPSPPSSSPGQFTFLENWKFFEEQKFKNRKHSFVLFVGCFLLFFYVVLFCVCFCCLFVCLLFFGFFLLLLLLLLFFLFFFGGGVCCCFLYFVFCLFFCEHIFSDSQSELRIPSRDS